MLGVVSCNIKEDMSDCPGRIILDYSAYPDEILDDIAADEQIDLFIFDHSGICIDIRTFTYGALSEQGFEFELPINYRNYNAVVWQGLNSENYTSNRMVLGESYENFYLRLVYDTALDSYSCVPDPLWASPLEPIEYCAKITRHRVYMTRLHTEIDVSVQEKLSDGTLVDLEIDEFRPIIHACNNVYHTDYDVSEESIMLDYTAEDEPMTLSDDSHICSCVGTLRITTDMECKLEVESSDGTNITIGGNEELDLVEYMLATKTDSSISDQVFLDLNKVWEINLIVSKLSNDRYISLGISINGWVRWFSSSDLN